MLIDTVVCVTYWICPVLYIKHVMCTIYDSALHAAGNVCYTVNSIDRMNYFSLFTPSMARRWII